MSAYSLHSQLLHSPDEGCGGTTENLGTRWQLLTSRNMHLGQVRETLDNLILPFQVDSSIDLGIQKD